MLTMQFLKIQEVKRDRNSSHLCKKYVKLHRLLMFTPSLKYNYLTGKWPHYYIKTWFEVIKIAINENFYCFIICNTEMKVFKWGYELLSKWQKLISKKHTVHSIIYVMEMKAFKWAINGKKNGWKRLVLKWNLQFITAVKSHL